MARNRHIFSLFPLVITLHIGSEKQKEPPKSLGGSLIITTKSLIYFTFSTIALKVSGLFMARSASTLRLISIPALVSLPMRTE